MLVIPDGYAEDIRKGPKAAVQVIIDGSDPTYGNAVLNYANAIIADRSTNSSSAVSLFPADVRARFLYNPDLKSSHFIIPGLVAVILMMVCALLTPSRLPREGNAHGYPRGVSVKPWEIVIGKVIPYVGLSLIDSVFILAFAKLTFNIPLKGDLVLLLGMTVIYIYCALGIGLFISSIAKTQQVAMMAALVATIMPSIMLSGFIFPIFSMPAPIKASRIVPANIIWTSSAASCSNRARSLCLTQALYLFYLNVLFRFSPVRFKTRVRNEPLPHILKKSSSRRRPRAMLGISCGIAHHPLLILGFRTATCTCSHGLGRFSQFATSRTLAGNSSTPDTRCRVPDTDTPSRAVSS